MPLNDREEVIMRAVGVLLGEADDKIDGGLAEVRAMIRELDSRIADIERRAFAATVRETTDAATR